MCHGVCRVNIHMQDDRVVKITGDKDSPTSKGYICSKGAASVELLYHPDRVLHPLRRKGKRGENQWKPISWDEALDEMAEKLQTIKKESGPEYFALTQGTSRSYTDFTSRFAYAYGTPNYTGIPHVCYVPRLMANAFTLGNLQMPAPDVYGFGGVSPECMIIWGSNITELGFPWKDYRSFLDYMLAESGYDFGSFCNKGYLAGKMRYRKYETGGFPTPSGKIELFSKSLEVLGVSSLPVYREPSVSIRATPETTKVYPLTLIGAWKIQHFFHSEGRQVKALRKRNPDPMVAIHPETATKLDIKNGDQVWVETPNGRVIFQAKYFDGIDTSVVNAQFGWWFPEEKAPDYGWMRSNVNLLFGESDCDPDIGSESLRSTLCRVYKIG